MIKTYRYNANRNTVSHILQGKNGVTVRYNFERGNVITKQKPELILKNEYAQNLLENSELFQKGLVTLIRSEKTIEDRLKENEEQEKETAPLSRGASAHPGCFFATPDWVGGFWDIGCGILATEAALIAKVKVTFWW